MKHLLTTTTLVATSLLLSACLPGNTTTQQQTQPQSESEMMAEAFQVGAAIAAGKPVSCVVTSTETGAVSTYQHKGEKLKVHAEANGETPASSMLSDGEFFYIWEDNATTGMKFPIPDPSAAPPSNMPEVPDLSKEGAEEEYKNEGYTLDCKEASLDDSEFVPPTTVTFQDTSAMMQESMQQMQQELNASENEMSEEQKQALEQMMQQFGQ